MPPAIFASAHLVSTTYAVFCSRQPVTAGSTVSSPGNTVVNWFCTDSDGDAVSASRSGTIPENKTGTTTGTCTDSWGNQDTASFTVTRK